VSADIETARGPITAGILLATVMTALDTTVANVALPHMQGSLSASPEQITWVLTSYIVAVAVTMPVSSWLASRLGLRVMLLLAVAGFTVSSALCGIATTLPEMVIFRLVQGIMAAPLAPLAQLVLLNINPPSRHGRAMALFTMASVVAPVVGPVIGGYLTENLSWRWCFYINVPGGILSMLLLWIFLPRERPEVRRFDFLGFGSLAIAVAALQLMLDRGPTQDWFQSREIWIEALTAMTAFWVYLAHSMTAKHPLFHPGLVRDRNFVAMNVIGFFVALLLFSSLTLLPLMMQGVMGYSVMLTGLLSMPRGVVMMAVLQVMGRLDTLVDRRLLVGVGLFFCLIAFWLMAHFDLSMTGRSILSATMMQGVGQGIIMVPLSTLAFATIDPALRADASAVFNLLRYVGGSIGISMIQAVTAINGQTMHASLAAHVVADDPVVRAGLPAYLSPDTVQGALALNEEITRQATMVAYLNDFRLMVILGVISAPLLLLVRKPRAGVAAAQVDAHMG
jgi:DHA2 family multidrug resistance protein